MKIDGIQVELNSINTNILSYTTDKYNNWNCLGKIFNEIRN